LDRVESVPSAVFSSISDDTDDESFGAGFFTSKLLPVADVVFPTLAVTVCPG
jgi:hypothetical protein